MALRFCSECGGTVSDKAERCPHCGSCIKGSRNLKKQYYWLFGTLGVIVSLAIGTCFWFYFGNGYEGGSDNVELTPSFISAIHHYETLDKFSEGMAAVCKGGKWGYINTKGEEVIPCRYGMAVGKFSDGLACVQSDNHPLVEFINNKGEVVLSGDWSYSMDFMGSGAHETGLHLPCFVNGVCEVYDKDQNEKLYINTKGERLDDYTPSWESDLNANGYFRFKEETEDGTRYGYKDKNGIIKIPARYGSLSNFSNGVAHATLEYGELYNPYVETNCGINGLFVIHGYVDENGNDTFTEADYNKIEEVRENAKREKQRQREEEEERRAEEERQRRMGHDISIKMHAYYYSNGRKFTNLVGNYGLYGDGGYGELRTDIITVPDGKYWQYKGFKFTAPKNACRGVLLVEPSEWGYRYGYFDRNSYRELNYTDTFTKMGGDRFFISWVVLYAEGSLDLEVLFTERTLGY